MSNGQSNLVDDFPDKVEKIHRLKTSDNHFARLYDEYDTLNRKIHRIETRVEPASDEEEEKLKRHRLHIKDELMAMLEAADA